MTKAPAQQGARRSATPLRRRALLLGSRNPPQPGCGCPATLGFMRQTTDGVGVSAPMTGPSRTATLLVDRDAGELFEMAHRNVDPLVVVPLTVPGAATAPRPARGVA